MFMSDDEEKRYTNTRIPCTPVLQKPAEQDEE